MNSIKSSHLTVELHHKEIPVPVVVDDNLQKRIGFSQNIKHDFNYNIKVTKVFAADTQKDVGPRGLIIHLTLKFKNPDEEFVYNLIPNDEFITELVECKTLNFVTSKNLPYFTMPISTRGIENVWMPIDST